MKLPRYCAPRKSDPVVIAETPDGKIVHIADAQQGLACGCICSNCGATLVARKGRVILTHSFAHYRRVDCGIGLETIVHKAAKEILGRVLELEIPAVSASVTGKSTAFARRKLFKFVRAELEHATENIVPDVILYAMDKEGKEKKLLVEVYVTHKCDFEKKEKIRAHGISAIEIDLRKLPRLASMQEIENELVQAADRTWLYNGWAEQKAVELEKQEEEKAQRQLQAKADKAARLAERLVGMKRKRLSLALARPDVDLKKFGLAAYVGLSVDGDYIFDCPNTKWQGIILKRYYLKADRASPYSTESFSTKEALSLVQDLVFPSLRRFISDGEISEIQAFVPEFTSPYHVVGNYLEALTKYGAFHRDRRGRWEVSTSILNRIEKHQADEKRIPEDTRKLKASIAKLLADLPTADVAGFDIEEWLRRPLNAGAASPAEFIRNDKLNHLEIELINCASAVKYGNASNDFLGLPLAPEARRYRERLDAERRRQEEQRRVVLENARRERCADLRDYVSNLDADLTAHLDTPCGKFSHQTPVAWAAESDEHLEQAKSYIYGYYAIAEKERQAIRIRESWKAKALREAEECGEPVVGRMFLNNYHPQYHGRPLDQCVDERGTNQVLEAMVQAVQAHLKPRRFQSFR